MGPPGVGREVEGPMTTPAKPSYPERGIARRNPDRVENS